VRRAQQAYRTRKEDHVAQLKEKCHELEGVVEDMTSTFIAFSDTLLNSEGVGLETTKQLRETMKKFLVLSETAAHHAEEATPSLDENNEPPAADPVVEESGSSSETINDAYPPQDLSTVSSLFQINPILRNTEIGRQTPVTYETNITDFAIPSPFANYGVWGIRPQHSRGSSIIPYVVAGRDSFASRLFYGSIVRGLRSLRGEGPPEDAYRIFRYKFRYLNPTQIQAILDGVLDTLLHGTSRPNGLDGEDMNPGEVIMSGIKTRIVREIELLGGSEGEYLSTWDVERYLTTKWRLSLDSNWVRIKHAAMVVAEGDIEPAIVSGIYDKYESFAPTVIPGFSQPKQVVWDVSKLVENLERLTITIGNGPRWHHKDVDAAIEAFLKENQGV
jgi:hypothetical protein